MYTVTVKGFAKRLQAIRTSDGSRFFRGVEVAGVSQETLDELNDQTMGLQVESRLDDEPAPEKPEESTDHNKEPVGSDTPEIT